MCDLYVTYRIHSDVSFARISLCFLVGRPGDRTQDALIKSQVLYH